MTISAAVGVGGFLGSLARYGLSGLVHRHLPGATFPYGTLTVNLLGCLVIGLLTGASESRQVFRPEARAFLLIGLLGGFTTFSTFGYETFAMLREGASVRAAFNAGAHVILGLLLVWLGHALATAR